MIQIVGLIFKLLSNDQKHAVPISAVPCLNYQRASEREEAKAQEEAMKKRMLEEAAASTEGPSSNPGPLPDIPCAKIESVQENQAAHSLNGVQLRAYCSKLFRFKTVRLMRFK